MQQTVWTCVSCVVWGREIEGCLGSILTTHPRWRVPGPPPAGRGAWLWPGGWLSPRSSWPAGRGLAEAGGMMVRTLVRLVDTVWLVPVLAPALSLSQLSSLRPPSLQHTTLSESPAALWPRRSPRPPRVWGRGWVWCERRRWRDCLVLSRAGWWWPGGFLSHSVYISPAHPRSDIQPQPPTFPCRPLSLSLSPLETFLPGRNAEYSSKT